RGSPTARSCCAASPGSATGRAPSADPSACRPIRSPFSPSTPGSPPPTVAEPGTAGPVAPAGPVASAGLLAPLGTPHSPGDPHRWAPPHSPGTRLYGRSHPWSSAEERLAVLPDRALLTVA